MGIRKMPRRQSKVIHWRRTVLLGHSTWRRILQGQWLGRSIWRRIVLQGQLPDERRRPRWQGQLLGRPVGWGRPRRHSLQGQVLTPQLRVGSIGNRVVPLDVVEADEGEPAFPLGVAPHFVEVVEEKLEVVLPFARGEVASGLDA